MLASLLYSIVRLLVDLLSIRDREQAEIQAEVLALRISCGCCNGRCTVRDGVPAIGWCRAAKVDQDHGPQIERALFASNF